jgi:catechol 2,3-dioxygenase-like lactoylglutathione lyase family enzyme
MPHDHPHDHDHEHDHGHHHHHSAPVLKLQAARIYCGDLDQAIAFYRDLIGLRLVKQAAGVAIFDTGAAQLTVEQLASGHPAHGEMVGRRRKACRSWRRPSAKPPAAVPRTSATRPEMS